MADLIVKAAVKEALDDKNVSSDFYGALDDEVTELPNYSTTLPVARKRTIERRCSPATCNPAQFILDFSRPAGDAAT